MIRITHLLLSLLITLTLPFGLFGQTESWQETTSKDGTTTIKYLYTSRTGPDGNEQMVVKYVATKTTNIDLTKTASYLSQAESYKYLYDYTQVSRKLKDVDADTWLLYYQVDTPWPLPDADCVHQVTSVYKENELKVAATAVPDAYEMKDFQRMDLNDIEFHLKKLESGKVELTIKSTFAPVGSVSNWMMNMWFPKGPEGIVNRLIEGVK